MFSRSCPTYSLILAMHFRVFVNLEKEQNINTHTKPKVSRMNSLTSPER